MSRRIHCSPSIAGALRNGRTQKLKGLFQHDNGSDCTHREAIDFLKLKQLEGWEVLPMGECDNFDKVNGCGGHEMVDPIEPSAEEGVPA